MSPPATEVPPGFEPLFRTSPYTDHIGPLYGRGSGAGLVVGLRIERRHCNGRGLLHGGVVSALADITLGYATAYATDPPQALVTAHQSVDFLGAAREGDWVEASLEASQLGKRMVFATCRLASGERQVARANAVFAVA